MSGEHGGTGSRPAGAGVEGPALIHRLFEAQAARTPHAPAVLDADGEATFAGVNARANRIARALRARGVAPEVPVGVCLPRGAGAVAAMLGVLKAGGAYVPLDPSWPAERNAYVLADAGVRVVLADADSAAALPPSAPVLPVQEVERAGGPAGDLPGGAVPENAAYLLYTSGSTGTPKGVLGTHAAAVNRFAWMWEAYPFRAGEVCCHRTSPAFVDHVWEVFGPLLRGVPIAVPDDHAVRDPYRLALELSAHQVTRVVLVPSLLRALLEGGPRVLERLGSVELCVCSGEALPAPLARAFAAALPRAVLLNLYGSSEVAADATAHRVPADPGRDVPIGRPIRNVVVAVLDGAMNPVAPGTAGELFVGGAGVARGYAGRPALTAERFLPDPAGGGGRLYRTGDRGRVRPDGTLEYLGRTDHQAKIHGVRVEPAEVEAALREHPAVAQAVVAARGAAGEARLAGYVVPRPAALAEGLPAALREHLRARLPGAMVPAQLCVLDQLPLTPSGKVDRAALPEPGHAPGTPGGAPRTAAERVVCGIWAHAMGTAAAGVDDDFAALGGHSLVAAAIAARVHATFHARVQVADVIRGRTPGALLDLLARALGGRAVVEEVARAHERAAAAGGDGAAPGVDRLLRDRGIVLPGFDRIPRRGTAAAAPLSFAEERLWFLDQLEPGSPFYNMAAAFRLRGPLRAGALRWALEEVARRHETLRSTFPAVEGRPGRVVGAPGPVPLPVTDLSALDPAAREAEALRLAGEDARRPFDLARGPVCRARLLRLGAEEHVLLLAAHHIVSDGWSNGVLFRELQALYGARLRGAPSPLPELPVQYADYAAWQRDALRGPALEEQVAYWRRRLHGAPAAVELPTDHPRPAAESFRGAHLRRALPRALRDRLDAFCAGAGTTPFTVMLAAFTVLVARWSGQTDVVVGSPVANRTRPEVEGLIGFFANTQVLRGDLSVDPPFRELVETVRETVFQAQAHQDVPFEVLVKELAAERSMSRSPLFQVMFAMQATRRMPLRLSGLRVERLHQVESGISKFDLTLFMYDEGVELVAVLEYATDLFGAGTMARFLDHYQALLAAAVDAPGTPVSRLPLLGAAERAQLARWNAGAARPGAPACIHDLVQAQARATPGAVAVVSEGTELSYRALDARANQLARHLRALGVGPDDRVGVCLERTEELAVALLAVARAGGAVLALDPAYPRERLAHMIADAGAGVVLVHRALRGRLPQGGARMVELEAERERVARLPDGPLPPRTDPANLLYVIYTSGTTGQPKGIGVTHRAFANLLAWQGLRPAPARTLAFATFGFCVSYQEMFGTWCSGGTLVMLPEEARHDLEEVMRRVVRDRVERLHLPFTALMHLAELAPAAGGAPPALREVITAGEPLQVTGAVRRFFAGLGECSLHNHYGASETHVVSSLTLRGAPAEWPDRPSAGLAIPGVELYVLDRHLAPVPAGVRGELYAGGACLPRGYLGAPALTAEKLVPNPFSAEPGARLYRTGDLARYRENGEVEVIGRVDAQVKVRGYRVETGEVEAVARRHPSVRNVAVVAAPAAGGTLQLVAYPVFHAGGAERVPALRDFLREHLPGPMVPSVFVPLAALPVNANGKLDLAALPAPDAGVRDAEGHVPPSTPTEAVLAEIWGEVLGTGPVGVHDDFFELGGHSLRATQAVARVRERCRVDLPLRALFAAPTVAELARVVEGRRAETIAPAIARAPRQAYRGGRLAREGA